MKKLLKQSRSFLLKSRGIINKSLVFGKVLDNRVLIGTHHKTGTVWMANIFNSIASYYDLKISANRYNNSFICPPGNFDIVIKNKSYFDFQNISNYKGLHIIREPRDIVFYGCFYHTKSSEKWLHIKREEFGGLTYQ